MKKQMFKEKNQKSKRQTNYQKDKQMIKKTNK